MQRNTEYGPVVGVDESVASGALFWKGLPYARPPVGALRWRAPAAPDGWTAPRAATQFGPPSVQTGRLYGPGRNNRHDRSIGECLGQTSGSEDCLYLNIWAPAGAADAAKPLPVIVFVHGGSNITGYTADPVYDGAALAVRANAVVVTVNYRLGIFGFLHLPHLKTGADAADDSGNFALLDIVAALGYVQRNIAGFGGDPGNVTLMGQSAGAVNICALLTSPLLIDAAPALVHRAVPVSGGISLAADMPPGAMPALQAAAARALQGHALLVHALIAAGEAADEAGAHAWLGAHSATDAAGWLRARSADQLLSVVLERLTPLGLASAGPIPDGVVMPADPLAAIRSGEYLKVPLLAGYTRDEGKLFAANLALSPALGGVSGRLPGDAAVFERLYDYDGERAPSTAIEDWIPAQYLPAATPHTGFTARCDLLTRMVFTPNRDLLLNLLRAQRDDVWCYQFDWDRLPAPFDAIYGAAHGFDMPFMFGNFGASVYGAVLRTGANQHGRLALSAAMMSSLGAFAWHGDPNHAELGMPWPAWPATLHFDASLDAIALSVQHPPSPSSPPGAAS
ncbi:carboxylesterase/lipase family protein, partial [Janthinobacterium sp. HH01]|uniref:carboxylesterase/lipase family protein n=1 Tax=Janthinobacterium sp. HH01 TaxID=1198452 RepID=UPI0005BE9BD7